MYFGPASPTHLTHHCVVVVTLVVVVVIMGAEKVSSRAFSFSFDASGGRAHEMPSYFVLMAEGFWSWPDLRL